MKYEFRVWNKAGKMPDVTPHEAKGRLAAIANAIFEDANKGNPDIIIDTNDVGEGAISDASISYYVEKEKIEDVEFSRRYIKMTIKGSLYLPPDTSLFKEAASSIVGKKGVENAKKDTLLLSKWVSAPPTAKETDEQPYYRAVVLSVLTKAGDFRVISANNMYVESYSETYADGEMGTFTLELKQKHSKQSKFNVDGLEKEKVSALDKIKGAVEKTAKVVAVAAVVAKATTETVEKFTGETKWTRYTKGIADSANSASNLTQNVTKFDKKNWDKSVKDISKSGSELVQNSKATDNMRDKSVTLKEMEDLYLDWIKADPKAYEAYRNANAEKKREMLEDASIEMRQRSKTTKRYEESQIDMEKVNDYEKISNAEVEAEKAKMRAKKESNKETPKVDAPQKVSNVQNLSSTNLSDMISTVASSKNNGNGNEQ